MTSSSISSEKKILVTGGLGFIGSSVVQRLHGEYDITILDWDTSSAANDAAIDFQQDGIRIYQNDIADPTIWARLEPCDYIFHSAAQTSADLSKDDPGRDFLSNAYGTFLVAEYARKCGATVIYCNSIRVYDTDAIDAAWPERRAISEGCPTVEISCRPQPPFAISKYTGELYLRQCVKRYEQVRVISHRMSRIVGPGQKGRQFHGWLSYLVSCAVNGDKYTIFGDGYQTRDVLHINDYVDLIEMEIRDFEHFLDDRFTVYNIGGGRDNELSINQVIDLLKRNHGLELDNSNAPARSDEPQHYVSDLTRISQKGWCPKHNDPEEIIDECVKWYQGRKRDGSR